MGVGHWWQDNRAQVAPRTWQKFSSREWLWGHRGSYISKKGRRSVEISVDVIPLGSTWCLRYFGVLPGDIPQVSTNQFILCCRCPLLGTLGPDHQALQLSTNSTSAICLTWSPTWGTSPHRDWATSHHFYFSMVQQGKTKTLRQDYNNSGVCFRITN